MKPVLTRPEIRRDAVRVLRAAAADTRFLLAAAERLPDFSRPALGVWASQDRVMPPGTAGAWPSSCSWVKIDNHTTLGLARKADPGVMTVKPVGNQAWPAGDVDLLGHLF